MKKKALSIFLLVFIMILLNSMSISVFAEMVDSENILEIVPNYTSIVLCLNNLTLNSGGKLSCEGETSVQRGYFAGVKMELQQLSKDWTSIKTWEATSDYEEMYLYKAWYVEKGSYRLKLTHTAFDSSGNAIETVTKYSKIVIY